MVHKSSAGITNLPTFIRNKCEVIGTKIVIIFNFHEMFVPILLEGQIQSFVWDGLFSTEQEILSCRVQRVHFSAKAFSQVELREILDKPLRCPSNFYHSEKSSLGPWTEKKQNWGRYVTVFELDTHWLLLFSIRKYNQFRRGSWGWRRRWVWRGQGIWFRIWWRWLLGMLTLWLEKPSIFSPMCSLLDWETCLAAYIEKVCTHSV